MFDHVLPIIAPYVPRPVQPSQSNELLDIVSGELQ